MIRILLAIAFLLPFITLTAQKPKAYEPAITYCNCAFKTDSSYIATRDSRERSPVEFPLMIDSSFQKVCGYLNVPENRRKASSRMIHLPFIIIKTKNPNPKKDPVLYTSGGPGNSSLEWVNGAARGFYIEERDCIAFEQRGTRFAIPYLRSFELDTALRESYRRNLNKDSMWIEGIKRYKKKLEKKGIDLAGYNSDESVDDIHDLLKTLKIDSVNLFGGSYSGSLMLSVLQKDPSRIRSLVLNSPLPPFTPIDEDEPVNFMEALNVLFDHVITDSINKPAYDNLKQRFHDYFLKITDSTFYFPYDTLQVAYTKNELLDAIINKLYDRSAIRHTPALIVDIINGNHAPYIKRKLEIIFNRNSAPDGMRNLVSCADQHAYHNKERVQQVYAIYPYLRGYRIHDVFDDVCNCWKVPPVKPITKQPFFSRTPVLMATGEMDCATRPIYMAQIGHYMINAQSFEFRNQSHMVGGAHWVTLMKQFLNNPYSSLPAPSPDVRKY